MNPYRSNFVGLPSDQNLRPPPESGGSGDGFSISQNIPSTHHQHDLIPLAVPPAMYYHQPSRYLQPPPPPPPVPYYIPPPPVPYYIPPPSLQSSAPPPLPPVPYYIPLPSLQSSAPPPIAFIPPPPVSYYIPPPSLKSWAPPPVAFIPPPPPPVAFIPPPPPPLSSVLPASHKENTSAAGEGGNKVLRQLHESGNSRQGLPPKPQKPSAPVVPGRRVETEEKRRLQKKKETETYLKDKQRRQKKSETKISQRTPTTSAGGSVFGSNSASQMSDRSRNRLFMPLNKPTRFIGRMKFRYELPDPTKQLKILSLKNDSDRFAKYKITKLENLHKPEVYPEPDLGIPLDLLDLSVFNPPKGVKLSLDPEDEKLLRSDDTVTPVIKGGLKRKERPSAKGVPWLVKTQYISPLSMERKKQPLAEKQLKELPERSQCQNKMDDSNSREKKLQEIEASFEACKTQPVHATNKKLYPSKFLPLLPGSNRDSNQFVIATFDCDPTGDSEVYKNLDESARHAYESQAIMKSYVMKTPDKAKQEKFLAYMVPSPDELSKGMNNEDNSYNLVCEYHWDVQGENENDRGTYLVSLGENEADYMPLPTKLVLRKRKATDNEVEKFPAPQKITVRRRSGESKKIMNTMNEDQLQHEQPRRSSRLGKEPVWMKDYFRGQISRKGKK